MRRRWSRALLVTVIGACQAGDAGDDAATTDASLDDTVPLDASSLVDAPALVDAPPVDGPPIDAAPPAGFHPAGALAQARTDHGAALLPDGRVLVVGGHAPGGGAWLGTSEIFDPASETFSPGPSTQYVHEYIIAISLADGRVLITGPAEVPGGLAPHTEIFDPATMAFVPGPDELVPQSHESATLLADGRVLLVDGSAETYDPSTSSFSPVMPLTVLGAGHEAVRLDDDRALFTGGPHQGSSGGGTRYEAEEFLTSTNAFVSTGSMATPRAAHSLVALPGARALVAGGYIGLGGPIEVYATAEVYDGASRTFAPTGAMTTSRFAHTATVLADGRVLLAGGASDGSGVAPHNVIEIVASAEVYEPASGTFRSTPPMSVRRSGHTATRLLDGRVLIVGGAMSPVAEIFQP